MHFWGFAVWEDKKGWKKKKKQATSAWMCFVEWLEGFDVHWKLNTLNVGVRFTTMQNKTTSIINLHLVSREVKPHNKREVLHKPQFNQMFYSSHTQEAGLPPQEKDSAKMTINIVFLNRFKVCLFLGFFHFTIRID